MPYPFCRDNHCGSTLAKASHSPRLLGHFVRHITAGGKLALERQCSVGCREVFRIPYSSLYVPAKVSTELPGKDISHFLTTWQVAYKSF